MHVILRPSGGPAWSHSAERKVSSAGDLSDIWMTLHYSNFLSVVVIDSSI